ncbi:hypothetical protein [Lentzea sp. E54]|uniref:hypothetical protein n=1 Tax=Lentzea xerophila TaxID=3435883 RepID=UPI003DA3792D
MGGGRRRARRGDHRGGRRQVLQATGNGRRSQAQAARDQVALLRKQIDMAEQDRHEQNAPQFTIAYNPSFGHVGEASWHTISYTSGPSQLDKVTISPAPGSEIDGVGVDEDEQNKRSSIELTSIVSGVGREFIAWLNDKDSGTVFLVSAETATGKWGPMAVKATDDY